MIQPRPITVTANAQSRIFGTANPTLTYAVSGLGQWQRQPQWFARDDCDNKQRRRYLPDYSGHGGQLKLCDHVCRREFDGDTSVEPHAISVTDTK